MLYRKREEWATLLQQMELLWTHDGNPKRPHALLTKGGHSNGLFNGGKLLFDHPRLARELAYDLVHMVRGKLTVGQDGSGCSFPRPMPNKVIGPAFGAITWADKIADALDIGCAFTVSEGDGGDKQFKLEKRFNLNGQHVLAVEDTITTGDSVIKTIEVALANGATVSQFIIAICNRSGLSKFGSYEILAMVDKHMENWTLEECPLCKMGSKAIRPKEDQNWTLLSAQY